MAAASSPGRSVYCPVEFGAEVEKRQDGLRLTATADGTTDGPALYVRSMAVHPAVQATAGAEPLRRGPLFWPGSVRTLAGSM